jgi:hypothetical protein
MAVTEADNLLVVVVVVIVVVFIESFWTTAVCTSLGLTDSFDLRSTKREDEKVAGVVGLVRVCMDNNAVTKKNQSQIH